MTRISRPTADGLHSLPLRVSEIFFSLQGETSRVGIPTTFIRLTGCPLRCSWCDSEYAFSGGTRQTIGQVLAQVAQHPTQVVCVTGGEPLAQKNALLLLKVLCDQNFNVSLETSGALDVSKVDPRVSRIVDIKAPDSGEAKNNFWLNFTALGPKDEIKVVISSREDYDWANEEIGRREIWRRCPIIYAPVQGQLAPEILAQWILDDGLPVRFQVQLHKILWGNTPGR